MVSRAFGVALFAGSLCASAQAAVFFTFDDPGAGPEITYTAGSATDSGVVNFTGGLVSLIVDGSQEGIGTTSFAASVAMEIFIGAVEINSGGILVAPILGGSLEFTDSGSGDLIFEGSFNFDASNGALLTLNSTGALLSTSTGAGLTLTEGAALSPFIGGMHLSPTFDIAFTLTNISPFAFMTQDGFISSFTANSAFTGNANLVEIPSPGSLALVSASMAILGVRRKRA